MKSPTTQYFVSKTVNIGALADHKAALIALADSIGNFLDALGAPQLFYIRLSYKETAANHTAHYTAAVPFKGLN